MKHVGELKPVGAIKKTTVAPAKIRFKTTFLTDPALVKAKKTRKSPPVSPSLEPLAAAIDPPPMTANFVEPPPPPKCPVCLEVFHDMPAMKKVMQLDRCNHFVCRSCIDQDSGVCPTADCGQRFLSTRRARKLTADEVVPAPLLGSPSKPKAKLKLRKWQQVSVAWEGNAYIATVTELGRGTFRVHYTGTNKKYDENLSREALQLRAPAWTRCDLGCSIQRFSTVSDLVRCGFCLSFLFPGSGSPTKTPSSLTLVAENHQANEKPLPISAALPIFARTEDKTTDKFTPTGEFEFRQRRSPRKKQTHAAKPAKARHKPRSCAFRESMNQLYTAGRSKCQNGLTQSERSQEFLLLIELVCVCSDVKTPRTAPASLATATPDLFSPRSLSGGTLPAWRCRPLPPGLTSHRRRPLPPDISLTDAAEDDSSEFELLLKVVDRACAGQYMYRTESV